MLKSLRTLSLLADGEDLFMSGSEMERPQEGELVASFSNFEVGEVLCDVAQISSHMTFVIIIVT